jgi:GlpG protein
MLDLGSIFEVKFSKSYYIKFILISGIFSNLLQYYFLGPSFGGMSGVIYGMLGFLWINKKLNQEFEFSLPKHDIILMIGWFFLCLFGIFPNVANFAHAGGLIVGIWWAVGVNFKMQLDRFKYIGLGILILFITVMVEKYHFHL